MILWHFSKDVITLEIGAYHPDKVIAIVTIPFQELQRILDDYQEFKGTGGDKTELLIEKKETPE